MLVYLLFADDGLMFCETVKEATVALQHVWSRAKFWGLSPNDKTEVKEFLPNGRKPKPRSSCISVEDCTIKWQEGPVRYLGVLFDHRLDFKEHVQMVLAKARHILGGFALLNAKFSLFTVDEELRQWDVLAYSRLWGQEVWSPRFQKELRQLDRDRLQKMFGLSSTFSLEAVYLVLGLLPLEVRSFCQAMKFYWKVWDMPDSSLEKQSLLLMHSVYRGSGQAVAGKSWIGVLLAGLAQYGVLREGMTYEHVLLERGPEGVLEEEVRQAQREAVLQQIATRARGEVKDAVRRDRRLDFVRDVFMPATGGASWGVRLTARRVLLKHKREFMRLFTSQHRLEVEYLRYFKGTSAVPRERRWCEHCRTQGVFCVGNEKHALEDCPQFASTRQRFWQRIRAVLEARHYTGCVYDGFSKYEEFLQRKQYIEDNSVALRFRADWSFLDKVEYWHVWTGMIVGAVLPEEAYREVAAIVGSYVSEVLQEKQRQFEVRNLKFSDTAVHGDVADV